MPRKNEHFDVIVIGGGPAGISAAFWCAELGMRPVVLEQEAEMGGQLLRTFGVIENFLGVEAKGGRSLCRKFLEQLDKKQVERFAGTAVINVDLRYRNVELSGGRRLLADNMVLATGVRRRRLGVTGESEFAGRGVLASGVQSQKKMAGKRVAIVGGGDAALENASILSKAAREIMVVHRRDRFSAREEFIRDVACKDNVELMFDSAVTAIVGNKDVEAVEITELKTGKKSRIAVDAVLIRIGVEPNTEMFRGQIALDESSYIVVDSDCSTSLSGVYAAGDVANPTSPTIATAVGMGATAAKAIRLKN